jgi:tRNA (mo5U34)-methyltransferase
MMQESQNALFINDLDPINAVIFDKTWLRRTAEDAGLVISTIFPPAVRGFHWTLLLTPQRAGFDHAEFPPDEAPFGIARPPEMPSDASRIGLSGEDATLENEKIKEPHEQRLGNIDREEVDTSPQIPTADCSPEFATQPNEAVDHAAASTDQDLNQTASDARRFLESTTFIWHQRFQLAPGMHTPATHDIEWLLHRCNLQDVAGMTVLDIGTNNGAVCFELERRGAARVVGVDIVSPDFYGFQSIKDFLGSRAEYVQSSVYDLPSVVQDRFDLVFFLGVLYHLRHPLLALDNVRVLTEGTAFVETAVADHELGSASDFTVARFYRRDELGNDSSNWFAPTVNCLVDWCWSCGLEPQEVSSWPEESPQRCLVKAVPVSGEPEYRLLSYERPIQTGSPRTLPRDSQGAESSGPVDDS